MSSEYKFTKGPWVISNNGNPKFGFYYFRQNPENWDGHGYQAIGRSIAETHASQKNTPYGDMFKANAMLISNAPCLIDALDSIARSNDLNEIKLIVSKAIEKATGVLIGGENDH